MIEGDLFEKPRSSISALIDILCTERYDEDSLDGIAEIVDSINLQPATGSVCVRGHSAALIALEGVDPRAPRVH